MMNSKNLGARIMGNGALDRKIWALKALKGGTIISGGSRGICAILSGWRALAWKNRGSCGVWEFFGDFGGFLELLRWFRSYLQLGFETEWSYNFLLVRKDHRLIYNNCRDLIAKK
jgi:hypothetical protein